MRGIIEKVTDIEMDYQGIHIIEMRDNKTVDKITLENFNMSTEEFAFKMISDLSKEYKAFLKRTRSEEKVKLTMNDLLSMLKELAE